MRNIFIPQKIKVGYQKRGDTYTGKLAYVIYYDQLGKLRKETSWQSWRSKDIDSSEFDNKPTEGFVLNKQIGGKGGGWDSRQSYCRIYDPRGFELEITTDNLLWILEWCDCLKGKGLSGKFVYGWVGDSLILVPECTDDYRKSKDFSDKLFTKPTISKKELEVGSSYKLKGEEKKMIYIGELKVQNRLGAGFSKKLMFCKEDNFDVLYPKSKTSILTKEESDVLESSEISEIVHRFSMTCFSWDFWNSGTEFIDHFEYGDLNGDSSKYGTINYLRKYIEERSKRVDYKIHEDYDRCRLTCGLISEDKKSVKLFKVMKGYEKEHAGYYYLRSWYRTESLYHLPFIDLDTSGKATKYYELTEGYYDFSDRYRYDAILDYDGNKVDPETIGLKDWNNKCLENGGTILYVTKDGYTSDSILSCILYDHLSFTQNTDKKISSESYLQYFKLPVKR